MFWILATLLIALAALFVLLPLFKSELSDPAAIQRRALRDARHAGVLSETELAARSAELPAVSVSPRAPLWLGAGLLLVLSAGALLGYQHFGSPAALDAASQLASPDANGQPPMSMAEAMSALEARLAQNPEDLEGWMLLGRSYRSEERFADALRAFNEAQRLAPDHPDVLVDLAEAQALNAPQRAFPRRHSLCCTGPSHCSRRTNARIGCWVSPTCRPDIRATLRHAGKRFLPCYLRMPRPAAA